jgi:curved DNA-binding protein CbpA
MRQLAAAAKSLREVKEAYRNFLVLWALDRLAGSPEAMARVAADMQRQSDQALADPYDHNWSLLYRGSVLDD